MNRFIFRLASVLRLREVEEDKKKQELGNAVRKLISEEKDLDRLGNSLRDHEKQMEKHGQGYVTAGKLRDNFYYARAMDEKIDDQKMNVREKQNIVDDKRAELTKSSKRKRILERLKERYREVHEQAAVKEEQTLIDEITSIRYKWSE